MTFSGDLGNEFDRRERHAELLGAPGEVVDRMLMFQRRCQLPLAESLLIRWAGKSTKAAR